MPKHPHKESLIQVPLHETKKGKRASSSLGKKSLLLGATVKMSAGKCVRFMLVSSSVGSIASAKGLCD